MNYKMIVIGGGHAAVEAALVGARLGHQTLLITFNRSKIGKMSCNPAIGGVGKGQAVREIDALGGEMGRATDKAGIQFKMLNRGKGPAVWSPRAQCDRDLYRQVMSECVLNQPNLHVLEDEVIDLSVRGAAVKGVITRKSGTISGSSVILATGTFMQGLLHCGDQKTPGGRIDESPSIGLSARLRDLGFTIGRLKTGTPPRLDGKTIDYAKCTLAPGDNPPVPMSHFTKEITQKQLPCWLTHTTAKTREIIHKNLNRSPLFSGAIKATGPRYCPSIEDKVVKFGHHESHHVFIEPEGYHTSEVYPNGISTSLPSDVQEKLVHSIPGFEKTKILRYGYAVEYDFCPPTQLKSTLETKSIEGLYFAGQINGTTGYEEAASQGLMAGINAVLHLRHEAPLVLRRDEAYIGVMIDDLVTKGTDEPYRLMTSRAEYRLLLRGDNADLRLMDYGRRVGLISHRVYDTFCNYRQKVWKAVRDNLPQDAESKYKEDIPMPSFSSAETSPEKASNVVDEAYWLEHHVQNQAFIEKGYWGYIKRQLREITKFRQMESRRIPEEIDYENLRGLLNEARQKFKIVRPTSLGQAARIPGVTPADMGVLYVHIERLSRMKNQSVKS